MSTTSVPPSLKPRRRWLQYSLRTLLVLMLVCGCGLGWLAREVRRARAQRKAAAAIEELGGSVEYVPVSGAEVRRAVAWLGQLFGEDLSEGGNAVCLGGTQVSDAGLAHLQGLTQLRSLYLDNTQVSDVGLAHHRGLTQLRFLSLDNTQVSDTGVAELKRILPKVAIPPKTRDRLTSPSALKPHSKQHPAIIGAAARRRNADVAAELASVERCSGPAGRLPVRPATTLLASVERCSQVVVAVNIVPRRVALEIETEGTSSHPDKPGGDGQRG